MNPTIIKIITFVAIAIFLIILLRFMQPKLPIREQFLLKLIQSKSPQLDNIRLFMFIKMVIHPVDDETDLDFQKRFLDDPQIFKTTCEQFKDFGAKALYPLLSFEALNWGLDVNIDNPLVTRLVAHQVCCRFPQTAEIIEDLFIVSPDGTTAAFVSKSKKDLPGVNALKMRYRANIHHMLEVIVSTKRNEWWPGTNPAIQDWAEALLVKYFNKPSD